MLQFRVATIDDLSTVHSLVETSFRSADPRPNWTAEQYLNDSFSLPIEVVESTITSDNGAYLVASLPSDPDTIIATVAVRHATPGLSKLGFLAVSPSAQRGGLGRLVVAEAEAYSKKTWGVTTMQLNALSTRHVLMDWYGRQGYVKTGETETKDFEDGTHLDLIMMEKPI